MNTTRTSFTLLGILVFGAVATTAAFVRVASFHSKTAAAAASSIARSRIAEESARLARARITEAAARYADAETAEIAASRNTIAGILADARAEVANKADIATQPFRGFGNATGCAAMGAKDKLCGGQELQDHIRRSLAPATDMLNSTREKILIEIATARLNSIARANNYRKEALQFAHDAGMDPALIDMKLPAIGEMANTLDHAIDKTISAEIGVSLELIFIKPTIEILMKVLEQAIATAAGTAGAAGTACVADGPLPIGDIIGAAIVLGGAVWTAHDVWQAVDENNRLPGKIETMLNAHLSHLDETATRALDQLEEGYQPQFSPIL